MKSAGAGRQAMGSGDTARDAPGALALAKSRAGIEARRAESEVGTSRRAHPAGSAASSGGGGGGGGGGGRGKFQHRGSGASLPAGIPPAHAAHVGRSWVFPARRARRCALPDRPDPRSVLASSSTPESPPKKTQETRHGGVPPILHRGYREVTKPIY